ncbi:flagellar biosynthetic protein FliR [Roseovarius indicus]|uniref:flagellar biosynthetic protein FliR n=1 Tax=Roseovarius indicus TaxID=540747 RepID=UPI0032EFA6CA
MMALAELFGMTGQLLWLHFIVFLRAAPAISLFPGFGDGSLPARVKLMMALMLTVVTAPILGPDLAQTVSDPPPLAWLVLTETGIGLLIGIGIRMFLLALQTAGSIAAQATSLSQILGNAGIEPMPAMGYLLVLGGIALAMMLGLHVRLAELMILTYRLFPVAELPEAGAVASWGVKQVAGAFGLAFTLAAPFVIVSVLYNLTLGIINRAMPQLMVVFVGAPVITGAGLGLLLVLGPSMLRLWIEALGAFMANPFGGG